LGKLPQTPKARCTRPAGWLRPVAQQSSDPQGAWLEVMATWPRPGRQALTCPDSDSEAHRLVRFLRRPASASVAATAGWQRRLLRRPRQATRAHNSPLPQLTFLSTFGGRGATWQAGVCVCVWEAGGAWGLPGCSSEKKKEGWGLTSRPCNAAGQHRLADARVQQLSATNLHVCEGNGGATQLQGAGGREGTNRHEKFLVCSRPLFFCKLPRSAMATNRPKVMVALLLHSLWGVPP